MTSTSDSQHGSKFCLQCYYALDWAPTNQCPECGAAFDREDPATYSPVPVELERAARSKWITVLPWVVLLALAVELLVLRPDFLDRLFSRWSSYVFAGLVLLFLMDLFLIHRNVARAIKLREQMDWVRLRQLHERALRTWRPVYRFIRWWFAPGAMETEYAADLFVMGDIEGALAMAQRGVERSRRKPHVRAMALELQLLALLSLRRYKDARLSIESNLADAEVRERCLLQQGRMHLYEGRVVQALSPLMEVIEHSHDTAANEARTAASTCHWLMGQFDEALAILDGDLIDGARLFDDKTMKMLLRSSTGRKTLAATRKRYAAAVVPSRAHHRARVHLTCNRIDEAAVALKLAEPWAMPETAHGWMRHEHLGYRAMLAAAQGHAEEAAQRIAKMREIEGKIPSRLLRCAGDIFEGWTAMKLSQWDVAIAAFESALVHVTHPIDRHQAMYGLALAAQGAGNGARAREALECVIADGFETRLSREAMEKCA